MRSRPHGPKSALPVSFLKSEHDLIEKEERMLVTLAVVLLILWLLGLISSYTLGGWLHILLVVAVIAILIQLISGRRGGPPGPVV